MISKWVEPPIVIPAVLVVTFIVYLIYRNYA